MANDDYDIEWEMSEQSRAQLARRIQQGTYGQLGQADDADSVEQLQGQIGREALTEQLAGTRDKKSRAWKNARDQLSRWRSGRRSVSRGATGRLIGAARGAHNARIAAQGSLHVAITATVVTSKKPWTGTMSADLTGGALAAYLQATQRDDSTTAAMIVADNYGLDPDIILGIEGVYEVESNTPNPDEDPEV